MPFMNSSEVTLGSNLTTAREMLGSRMITVDDTYGERSFRYCKAGATLAVGDVVIPVTASWNVTNVIPNADDGVCAYGVAIAIITSGSYGWVQTGGIHAAVRIASIDTSAAIGKAICSLKSSTGQAVIAVAAASTALVGQVAAKLGFCTVSGANPATTIAVCLTGCAN